MERGLLMGDSNQRSYPIVASKAVGSFKIDSISKDLADANDKSSSRQGKCDHFSIRGYVSEVRKKNWKLCWPFLLDGDLDKLNDEKTSILPPLNTPNFRLWSCQNCIQETDSKSTPKDQDADINCCDIGSNSNKTYAEIPPVSDAPMLLSDCQQVQSYIVEGKGVEAHISAIGNGNEQHPSSRSYGKNKGKDEVAPTTIIENENALEDCEILRVNSAETEVSLERTLERHEDDTGALNLEGNGSVEVCKPGCESHQDTNVALDIVNNKLWNKSSSQTSEAENQISAEGNHKESNASGKITGMVDKADNAIKVQTNVYHPLVLDECDYALSENLDKPSGLNRKKGRKVRFLSELPDAKADCIRTEDSPSNTISNTYGAGTVSQSQVSVQENARLDPGENKKRKLPEEEEHGCREISPPKSLDKKVKAFERDEETTNGIADSELEEDAVARISLQADRKSNWSRFEIERIPTADKRKNKKSNDFGKCSSLVPPEDDAPIETLGKVGNSSQRNATRITSYSPTYDASAGRGIDQIPLSAPKAGRRSGFSKRKGKMPQVDNGQASLFPYFPWTGMLRKGLNTKKDVQIMQTGHQFHLVEDASAEKGLDLSLNSYLTAQRCDRTSIPQSQDGFPSLSTWKDGTSKLDEFMRKNVDANYATNPNKSSKSVSNAFSGKGVHGEHINEFYTYSMPILNEKQAYSSQVEQGSCSLQQMDISHARNKEKLIEVQKNSAVPVSRKLSHRADNMSQQGVPDDIPMEIVELMAKNQYERCLHDAEKNKHIIETANKPRNAQVMDHSYGIGDLRMVEETNQKRKPQARNAKNGITTRKNVGPSKQNSVDYSTYINEKDFGVSRLDQMHCPIGFNAFSHSQKKLSARDQFPATGYTRCSCAQNCKWNGDILGNGFSHSSLRTVAAGKTCQSVQSKEEASRLWSFVMRVQTPLTYNPQKCAAQPSNVERLSHSQAQGSLHKGNFNGDYDLRLFNLNATNPHRHNKDVGSETFRRTNAEYSSTCKRNGTEPRQNSVGSLDPYSNETIPAMHLLSLMDAGMRSGGNPKFLKRPFSNDLCSKEYSAPDIGVYKATDTMKHPSSNCYSKSYLPEKSLDLFPMNPGGASTSSTFQHSKGFRRATDFMGQVSIFSRKKENIQGSNAPAQNRDPGSQKAACTGGSLGKRHGIIPVMQKVFATFYDPMMSSQHCDTIEDPTLQKAEAQNAKGAMKPPKSSSVSLICSINRNPADFTVPGDNEYMIRGEDLRVRDHISAVKRHLRSKVDQNRRHKNKEQSTGKERRQ